MMDAVLLARIQFALTIMFHYLFPPLTIGLGVLIVIIESIYIRTGDIFYKNCAFFWTKLFAVNFALGVSTGIVMEFEFGTNWATYARFVGDVFGSALAAEGIFAFFLESGFLAILVFGWDRVSPRLHFFSSCMVAVGSIFSSIWIVIANSWQQTPAGFHVVKTAAGFYRAEITDFWAMVFNPSSMHRLLHVLLGAGILGAFFSLSIAAYYLLRNKHVEFGRFTCKIALVYAALASCGELMSGHFQADAVADNQPAKLAALEGHFHTGTGGTQMYLFGIPDQVQETVHFGVGIPGLLSVLVHNDPNKPVIGLDRFPVDERPPVVIPFLSYHLMAGLGMWFILASLLGLALLYKGRLFRQRWLLWCYVFTVFGAYAANEAGWVSAEVGRQPWAVYHLLRTKDAISHTVPTEQVMASIIMFAVVYAFLFAVWIYVMNDKIHAGPEGVTERAVPMTELVAEGSFWRKAAELLESDAGSMTETVSSSDSSDGKHGAH